MKVALLTHPATSVLRGGPRVQLEQTARELTALGVDVHHITGENQLGKDSVDLVHIFGAGMGTYHIARALHLASIPIVLSPIYITRRSPLQVRAVRSIDGILRRVMPGFWTDYGMIAEMCSWAKIVAPNTRVEANLFRDAFGVGSDRIMTVPNGVEERFAHASKDRFVEAYGLQDFILNVGHIGPARKNVGKLLEAVQGLEVPTVIIGRIEDTMEGRSLVSRAKENPNVTIIDHVDHDSELLASAYAACRLFVLPSLFETPGIAALEAGLAGATVVITPHAGTREYFGDHAVYVDPYSSQDIRRGITQGLERSPDQALSQHISSQFLWSHVARRTLEIYRTALAS
jgi:glycosyltransferase involved in cell wall biosynthesis